MTHVVYDGAGRLIGEYNELGHVRRETIRLRGMPVAMVAGGALSGHP